MDRLIRALAKVLGLLVVVLGIHGVFVAANRLGAIFSSANNDHTKLFFAIDIPIEPVQSVIAWMTGVGFNGYIFPIVVIVIGGAIVSWSSQNN